MTIFTKMKEFLLGKYGRFHTISNSEKENAANQFYNLIFIYENGNDDVYLFTDFELKRAKERAEKNKEDI